MICLLRRRRSSSGGAQTTASPTKSVRRAGLWVGTEVNGAAWISAALDAPVDYYIVHCYDTDADYTGLERLLGTGRPVIVAQRQAQGRDGRHPVAQAVGGQRRPPRCETEVVEEFHLCAVGGGFVQDTEHGRRERVRVAGARTRVPLGVRLAWTQRRAKAKCPLPKGEHGCSTNPASKGTDLPTIRSRR